MRRWVPGLGLVALVGCFTDVPVDDTNGSTSSGHTSTTGPDTTTGTSATTSTGTGTSTSASTSTSTDVTSSTTSSTSSTASSDATSNDEDIASAEATTTVDSGYTDTEEPLGPRIVRSVPANGETGASLQPYFYLYFDRVVSPTDATGHIFVAQGDGELVPVAPLQCPPDYDPTCIAAVFPTAFREPGTEQLPGSTVHRIVLEGDFPDPDGVTNPDDQTIEFTTLEYTANAFTDAQAIDDELGGVAYDPTSENLYLFGSTSSGSCVVRRVPMPGGVFGVATTVAEPLTAETGQSVCYGASLYDGALFVTLTYDDHVVRYNDLSLESLSADQTVFGPMTDLPEVDGTLGEVWSVAAAEDRVFFAFGNFHGGVNSHSILEYSDRAFSVFNDGSNLWMPNGEVVVATGEVDGIAYLFAYDMDQIHKFRLSDGVRTESIDLDTHYSAHMVVDAYGRLYLGHGSGIITYDANTLEVVKTLSGFAMSRFAVIASETEAIAIGGEYRSPAALSRVVLEF